MALVKGNKTTANPTPNANTYTISHNHNVGADGYLLVVISQNNGQSVSGVKYNGSAMTQVHTLDMGGISTRYTAFKLAAPATGANDLVFTFSAAIWNPIVFMAMSFTGCGDIIGVNNAFLANSPHSASPVVSANSILYVSGNSSYTISGITIDGTLTNSPDFDHDGSVNGKRFTGEVSTNLSTGARTGSVDTGAPSFQVSNHMIEIQEAGGGGPTGRRRILIV